MSCKILYFEYIQLACTCVIKLIKSYNKIKRYKYYLYRKNMKKF